MTDGPHDDRPDHPGPAPDDASADEPTNVFPATAAFPVPPAAPPGPPPPPGYPPPSGPPPGASPYAPPPGGHPQPQYGAPPPPPGYPAPQYGAPPPPGYPHQPPPGSPHQVPPPPPGGSDNGGFKTVLLILVAIVAIGVAGAVALAALGSSDDVKEFGTAPSNTYDAKLTTCRTTATGTPEMTIDFTNRSGVARRFHLRAGYFDGDEQVGISRSARTGPLEDGESETLTLLGGVTPPRGFTCRILTVSFNGR